MLCIGIIDHQPVALDLWSRRILLNRRDMHTITAEISIISSATGADELVIRGPGHEVAFPPSCSRLTHTPLSEPKVSGVRHPYEGKGAETRTRWLKTPPPQGTSGCGSTCPFFLPMAGGRLADLDLLSP